MGSPGTNTSAVTENPLQGTGWCQGGDPTRLRVLSCSQAFSQLFPVPAEHSCDRSSEGEREALLAAGASRCSAGDRPVPKPVPVPTGPGRWQRGTPSRGFFFPSSPPSILFLAVPRWTHPNDGQNPLGGTWRSRAGVAVTRGGVGLGGTGWHPLGGTARSGCSVLWGRVGADRALSSSQQHR